MNPIISVLALIAAMSASLTGCGGESGTTSGTKDITVVSCKEAPLLGTSSGQTLKTSSFGATPGAGIDNQTALQRALDAMKTGDILIFDLPGVYEHSDVLRLRTQNTIVDGKNVTIKGTNPEFTSLWLQENNIEIRNFNISNLSDGRRNTPWSVGIAAYPKDSGKTTLNNLRILNNHLLASGPVGSSAQLAGGGIFIYNTQQFIVANNHVSKTFADGIHVTGGAKNGVVSYNLVENTGDDGIAVVSYMEENWQIKAAADARYLPNYEAIRRASNVLIYGNTVSSNYWGRGITVVGGKNVTIENNTVNNVRDGAGIYIAREEVYNTMGVTDVIVKNNKVDQISTIQTNFYPQGVAYSDLNAKIEKGAVTGQGGIDIYASLKDEDLKINGAVDALTVNNVSIQDNNISNTRWPGLRIGYFSKQINAINLINNNITKSQGSSVAINTEGLSSALHCSGNIADQSPWTGAQCQVQTQVPVTGFTCYQQPR